MRIFAKNITAVTAFLPTLWLNAAEPLPEPPQQKAWRNTETVANFSIEDFKPELDRHSIVCGNKRVTFTQDGAIRLSNENGLLATIYMFNAYEKDGTETIDWGSFSADQCKMNVEGGNFLWTLRKSLQGDLWDAGKQQVMIEPDGLIRIKMSMIPPPEKSDWEWKYIPPQVFIQLPQEKADGTSFRYNGEIKSMRMTDHTILEDSSSKQFVYVPYEASVSNRFTLSAQKGEVALTSMYPDKSNKTLRIVLNFTDNGTAEFTLDLRKSIRMQANSDMRGDVNFQAVENLELPDNTQKNLFRNASFECGLETYRLGHLNRTGQWDWRPFTLQSKEVFHGNNALLINARPTLNDDFRSLTNGVSITTGSVVLSAGKYTISFYAKCEEGKRAKLNAWVPNFHPRQWCQWLPLTESSKVTARLTSEWKRYSMTFEVERGMPLNVHFNASSRDLSKVYLDALQLEKGDKATVFAPSPVEGQFLTSDPQNFVSAKFPLNAKMQITTAKPNCSGTMRLRVKNFFGESLFDREFAFHSDEKSVTNIALPLEELPGLGLFMVRADYKLSDGTIAYEHHRYAKIDYLDNTHRLKEIFALDYSCPELHFNFHDVLDRWKKLGVGSKGHHLSLSAKIWEEERNRGVIPSHIQLASYTRDNNGRLTGFAFTSKEDASYVLSPSDPDILIKDFKQEGYNKPTKEYLEKLKKITQEIVAKHPHITMWGIGSELIAKFPKEWWNEEGSENDMAGKMALMEKAFVEGVKAANPKALVFQDAPCNMRPDGGIAETENLLIACNRLGVKFDVIGIHTYRERPESPDLDADTQTLLKMLERNGYGNTPVIWPEGMHWGPFEIPQWGTLSSSWQDAPVTWPGDLLSYDMGWTEKRSAAWYARSWLVALKYADRIRGATAGNTANNCYMDAMMTPYAAQLIPNTLGHVLGDVVFRKDIRFAPFVRVYVFEDTQKRPIAAVWCHMDKVDDGYAEPPVAVADFGNWMEGITDIMNSPRAPFSGTKRFQISSFPIFLRGKPGTLKAMISSLEKAVVVSGDGTAPVMLSASPRNEKEWNATLQNFLSVPFHGILEGQKIEIPPSSQKTVVFPLPRALSEHEIIKEKLVGKLKTSTSGRHYPYDLSFEGLIAKKIPKTVRFDSVDWSKLPAVRFPYVKGEKETDGIFRIAWNELGLFVEAVVQDKKFIHIEYKKTEDRWNNDCLQLYIDTMANARTRQFKGYDEDDYEYGIFPNAGGTASIVYRAHVVDQQLGLATQAPANNTIAEDIPSSFSNKDGVLTYRIFIPGKYLLPLKLQKGYVFGFGLYAANADEPGRVSSALTLAADSGDCYNKPHTWPLILLAE